jgi:hypothetical protein
VQSFESVKLHYLKDCGYNLGVINTSYRFGFDLGGEINASVPGIGVGGSGSYLAEFYGELGLDEYEDSATGYVAAGYDMTGELTLNLIGINHTWPFHFHEGEKRLSLTVKW